jgi:hypothetical protein
MPSDGELTRLAERKLLLQARADVRRWECAAAAAELARPLAYVDHGYEAWRRISPIARALGLPLGLIATRLVQRRRGHRARSGRWATLLSAVPAVIRGIKLVNSLRAAARTEDIRRAPIGDGDAAPSPRLNSLRGEAPRLHL